MAKPRDKIAQWKHNLEYLSLGSKIIGQSYCQWLNLPTTMPIMPALATLHLNSMVASIPEFYSKKILTLD